MFFVYCQFHIYSYIYWINLSLVFYSDRMESTGMDSHSHKMLASISSMVLFSSDSTHDVVKTTFRVRPC